MILILLHGMFNKYVLNVGTDVKMTYLKLLIRELGYIIL